MGRALVWLLGGRPLWAACGQAWRAGWWRADGIAAKQTFSTQRLSELQEGIEDLRTALTDQERALLGLRSDVADLHTMMASSQAETTTSLGEHSALQTGTAMQQPASGTAGLAPEAPPIQEARLAKLQARAQGGKQTAEEAWGPGEHQDEEYDLHPLEAAGVPCGAVYCTLRVIDEQDWGWEWYPPPSLGTCGDLVEGINSEGAPFAVLETAPEQVAAGGAVDRSVDGVVDGAGACRTGQVPRQGSNSNRFEGGMENMESEMQPEINPGWHSSRSTVPEVKAAGSPCSLPSKANISPIAETPRGGQGAVQSANTDADDLTPDSRQGCDRGAVMAGIDGTCPDRMDSSSEYVLHRRSSGNAGSIADSVFEMASRTVERWKDVPWSQGDYEFSDGQSCFQSDVQDTASDSGSQGGNESGAVIAIKPLEGGGKGSLPASGMQPGDTRTGSETPRQCPRISGLSELLPWHCGNFRCDERTMDSARMASPSQSSDCGEHKESIGAEDRPWSLTGGYQSLSHGMAGLQHSGVGRYSAFINPLFVTESTVGTFVDDGDDAASNWSQYPDCGPVTPRVDPEAKGGIWYPPVYNPLFADIDNDGEEEEEEEEEGVELGKFRLRGHDRPIGLATRAVSIHTAVGALKHMQIRMGGGTTGALGPGSMSIDARVPNSLAAATRQRGGDARCRLVERH
ncbi:unnamed protein product [Ostreobium quekettii]|uniref:Uncharacterized protein n=1 Tax=Ostreobium quekettii TaxID=121088 RepID=A0A8S1IZT0_9CHLO|nr:unnamed protein product [Ostreobium quekettii]